ncbi:tetraacyldisaccharide 4'-kinase [Phenylobacterium sp.]|uniref:tetraacyldisaccharide 4'-kinase n=1 Tax=Phenylobacterium sp. TaxID=1871053 RepID=UPI0027371B1D|nr:tetraacyldisaccharide 4'-kinase [Phenylobacterium sp.]MDP3659972.1 tetraacyldisaccharide 4'-kinase [Phenylobacterium sp.]
MRLATPRGWYRKARPSLAARLLLGPLAAIWAGETRRRIAGATPVAPPIPVICVGNLTLGGTGKTPVVREIVQRLRAAGVEAHALSRGYGGRLSGPVRVDPTIHGGFDVGDEPLMIAASLPMWIARDRPAGVVAASQDGAAVVVMDDGHQNPSLRKALSIVVVDAETRSGEWPFGSGAVFPLGPMREPLAEGLARADAVVLLAPADLDALDPELMAALRGPVLLTARLIADAPPPPGSQIGFAGVGKPWKVERALLAAGCDLVGFEAFPDHHPYAEADLQRLAAQAGRAGAGLVTTEKDWVRLPPEWRTRVVAWTVRAAFDDPAALDALLASALKP